MYPIIQDRNNLHLYIYRTVYFYRIKNEVFQENILKQIVPRLKKMFITIYYTIQKKKENNNYGF